MAASPVIASVISPVIAPAVKSALRTLRVLELFAELQCPQTLAAIARRLDMPKSSCLALLTTLADRGYLYRGAAAGAYYPTRRWLHHASRVAEHDPVANQVRASLVRLRDRIGETVIDAVLAGDQSVYVDVVESTELVRLTARPGDCKPLHVSASGRAQLGVLAEAERAALVGRLVLDGGDKRHRMSRRALTQTVQCERERGWSSNLGEFRPDVASVAVGLDLYGTPHAILVAAPLQRLAPRIDEVAALLRLEVDALAQRLL
ncbi:MAG: IclR family transcriptional regulator [Pseudomonadota bacterium]|nr:IclR family transcriptional regulator [Pseudomonadota bacterium]